MFPIIEQMFELPRAGACLDAVVKVQSLQQKFDALADYCAEYGLTDVFYGRRTADEEPLVGLRKWNMEWDKIYKERRYFLWDEAMRIGRTGTQPFLLRPQIRDMSKMQKEFYAEAERYNRLNGFALPLPPKAGGVGGFSTTGVDQVLPPEIVYRICAAAYIFDLCSESMFASEVADELNIKPRERMLLRLLADGRTHREIAVALQITEDWAHKSISRLREKLEVSTNASLIYKAMKLGLLP